MYADIADHYRDWGLQVVELPGWETRGHGAVYPEVTILHHDAIPARWEAPGPPIFWEGRPGLPGPITNCTLDSEGVVGMIAAGLAYHAGLGSWAGFVGGNSITWGCEAQNSGTGQVWPAVQIDAYVLWAAATADYFGYGADRAARHAEWAGPRKIDAWGPWQGSPYRWETHANRFRALVAAAEPPGKIPDLTPILGDDMLIYGTDNNGKPLNVVLFPAGGSAELTNKAAALHVGPRLGTQDNRIGKGTTNQAVNAADRALP